jgi:hypothetical protein
VRAYYKGTPSFTSRSATRALPATVTPSPSTSAKKTNIGAIAGGTVGGLVALIVILCLILFCLHRRKKAQKNGASNNWTVPPTELAASQLPQEMSSSGAGKYVSTHERPSPNELPSYSGLATVQSRTTGSDHGSSNISNQLQAYNSTPRHPTEPYSSLRNIEHDQQPRSPLRSPYNAELFFPQDYDHDAHNAQQVSLPQQRPVRQRQYSYPTTTSPQQAMDTYTQQYAQVYYPPPQDSSHSPQDLHPLAIGREGSRTGEQDIIETQHGNTHVISTSTTPAHFYAQPVAMRVSGDHSGGKYSPVIQGPGHNQWST